MSETVVRIKVLGEKMKQLDIVGVCMTIAKKKKVLTFNVSVA